MSSFLLGLLTGKKTDLTARFREDGTLFLQDRNDDDNIRAG